MAADEGQAPGGSPLERGADRIRETSKWLITIFAAVGAALIAGSQLSSLGSLAPGNWPRFAVAAAGVLVALGGVAWAIWAAVDVAVSGRVSLRDLAGLPANDALRMRLDNDRALLAGHADVAALNAAYQDALQRRKTDVEAYYANTADQNAKARAQTADANARFISQVVQNVLAVAAFEKVTRAFKDARRYLFFGAVTAAAGIVAFAAAANPPKAKPKKLKVEVAVPAQVTFELTEQGKRLLGAAFAKHCDVKTLDAVVLKINADTVDVVTLPVRGCAVRRLTLPVEAAKLSP